MKKIIFIFYAFCFLSACSHPEEDTTEVIAEVNDNTSMKGLSKSYRNKDIIEVLYNKEIQSNEKLKALVNQINKVESDSFSKKTDSYLEYKKTNENYWQTVKGYTNSIQDSLAKKSIQKIFERLNKDFDQSIANHENKMNNIDSLSSKLSDEIILMKLLITQPMMQKYQKEKLPQIAELQSLIEDYQKLLEQTKTYSTEK
ncbi:MAG: hypothetical protein CSA38_05305 [Flavobacteriales bacterium]|nr:MAG: hypothetical protein CSA38_05305 [Flavobacteriales bacterium]